MNSTSQTSVNLYGERHSPSISNSIYIGVLSSNRTTWTINKLLLLPLLWGTIIFGQRALFIVAISVFSSVIFEIIILILNPRRLKQELLNGTTIMYGLLIGLSLPVTTHWLIAVLASSFAILFVKWGFGGSGYHWVHPPIAGRLFAELCWPSGFKYFDWGENLLKGINWNIDAISSASIQFNTYLESSSPYNILRPMSIIERTNSSVDTVIGRALNENIFLPLGTVLPEGYIDYFLGFRYGAIGETSIILLLGISVYLFARRIIAWQIPIVGFTSMIGLSLIFSGRVIGLQFVVGDALFAIMSGSFVFSLLFYATNPNSTPHSSNFKSVYALIFTLLLFIFQKISNSPNSTSLALLIASAFSPLFNQIHVQRSSKIKRTRELVYE